MMPVKPFRCIDSTCASASKPALPAGLVALPSTCTSLTGPLTMYFEPGGYKKWKSLGIDKNYLPVWLQQAG